MKKIYQSEKWKKHMRRRQRRTLVALRRKRKVRSCQSYEARRLDQPIKIKLPVKFDLLGNIDEILDFFDKIRKAAVDGQSVFLDMADIEVLCPEALLYTLCLFDFCDRCHGFNKFSGNMPKKTECQKIFSQSGFFNHIKGLAPQFTKQTSDILQIEIGNSVNPVVAKKVIDFALQRLGSKASIFSKRHYETIIECMANTKNHAYTSESSAPNWYLMAMYYSENKRVRFAFIDGGLGIPRTIKKEWKEGVRKFFSQAKVPFVEKLQDKALIMSALNGDFRTRTSQEHRGYGLPKIYESSQKKLLDDVRLISNRGYINCTSGESMELNEKFRGTLWSWDFIKDGL